MQGSKDAIGLLRPCKTRDLFLLQASSISSVVSNNGWRPRGTRVPMMARPVTWTIDPILTLMLKSQKAVLWQFATNIFSIFWSPLKCFIFSLGMQDIKSRVSYTCPNNKLYHQSYITFRFLWQYDTHKVNFNNPSIFLLSA